MNTPELLKEIAQVMRERPDDWWRDFEAQGPKGVWFSILSVEEMFESLRDCVHIRRRPRTITIAGIEVPEPMREALEEGADYWVASPESILLVCSERWHGQWVDYQYLEKGLIHADKESAQQHARAMIWASGGSVDDD